MQLEVPAADGVVGERELPAVAADERRRVGQLEPPALVGALEDTRRVSTKTA